MTQSAEISESAGRAQRSCAALFAIILVCIGIVIVGRVLGPGDMYEKDQPKTLAYTMDIVVNHRWALPRDVLGQPATKPPMYNWMSAPLVWMTGRTDEWMLKFPSLLGTVAVACVVWSISRRLLGEDGNTIGLIAAGIWVANGPVLRLMYLGRPDMLQAAWLTAAWALATLAVRGQSRWQVVAGFWICVAGAALTKGPACALVIVYAQLAGLAVGGKFRATGRLKWQFGLPAALAVVGLWLMFAINSDRAHVMDVMLRQELLQRAVAASPEGISLPFWYIPSWFGGKFLPWSVLTLAGVLIAGRWPMKHPLSPVILWLTVVIVGLSFSAGKRIDYLLPAYAPGAILAAWSLVALCKKFPRFGIWPATIPVLAMAAYLAHFNFTRWFEAKEHLTDHAIDFARQVRSIVGDEPLVVLTRGKDPLATLLHRHFGDGPDQAMLASARWAVLPLQETGDLRVVSEPVAFGFDTIDKRPRGRVALYRIEDLGSSSNETLGQLRSEMLTWTKLDNPYRSIRTDELLNQKPEP
jgi:4-amino-4-deoxy-L-arabinose transferase-like glycosyltransferase